MAAAKNCLTSAIFYFLLPRIIQSFTLAYLLSDLVRDVRWHLVGVVT